LTWWTPGNDPVPFRHWTVCILRKNSGLKGFQIDRNLHFSYHNQFITNNQKPYNLHYIYGLNSKELFSLQTKYVFYTRPIQLYYGTLIWASNISNTNEIKNYIQTKVLRRKLLISWQVRQQFNDSEFFKYPFHSEKNIRSFLKTE